MSDLISRSALIEALDKEQKECEAAMISPDFFNAKRIVREQPTIEAAPVVHGEWIVKREKGICICSRCKTYFADDICWINGDIKLPNFCPNCGADMKGGAE